MRIPGDDLSRTLPHLLTAADGLLRLCRSADHLQALRVSNPDLEWIADHTSDARLKIQTGLTGTLGALDRIVAAAEPMSLLSAFYEAVLSLIQDYQLDGRFIEPPRPSD